MIIRHERPDPAFSYRVEAPLLLQTGPEAFLEVREWSPEGYRVPDGWPREGGAGTLTIPFQGIFLSFNIDLPAAEPGDFVHFEGLNGREQELLRHFHDAIVGGRMSSIEGVIRSIDRPVDLVPMVETEEDGGRVPARPRRRLGQTVRAVLLYGGLAVLLWTTLWSQAWDRLNTLPLQSGRYETYNAAAALATGSGWIDHRHAIEVHVGMDATMSLNVGGKLFDLPAVVVDIYADREPEGRAKSGYIVEVIANAEALRSTPGLTVPAQLGGPAEIRLSSPLLPALRRGPDAREVTTALGASHVPLVGPSDAN
jgi:hypothetical protein